MVGDHLEILDAQVHMLRNENRETKRTLKHLSASENSARREAGESIRNLGEKVDILAADLDNGYPCNLDAQIRAIHGIANRIEGKIDCMCMDISDPRQEILILGGKSGSKETEH